MHLGSAPADQFLQVDFHYKVEIVEIAGAPLQSARHRAHDVAAIAEVEDDRPLTGRMFPGMDMRMWPDRRDPRADCAGVHRCLGRGRGGRSSQQ